MSNVISSLKKNSSSNQLESYNSNSYHTFKSKSSPDRHLTSRKSRRQKSFLIEEFKKRGFCLVENQEQRAKLILQGVPYFTFQLKLEMWDTFFQHFSLYYNKDLFFFKEQKHAHVRETDLYGTEVLVKHKYWDKIKKKEMVWYGEDTDEKQGTTWIPKYLAEEHGIPFYAYYESKQQIQKRENDLLFCWLMNESQADLTCLLQKKPLDFKKRLEQFDYIVKFFENQKHNLVSLHCAFINSSECPQCGEYPELARKKVAHPNCWDAESKRWGKKTWGNADYWQNKGIAYHLFKDGRFALKGHNWMDLDKPQRKKYICESDYLEALKFWEETIVPQIKKLIKDLKIPFYVITPSGGYHLFLGYIPHQGKWQIPSSLLYYRNKHCGEIKARGGYVVSFLSKGYQIKFTEAFSSKKYQQNPFLSYLNLQKKITKFNFSTTAANHKKKSKNEVNSVSSKEQTIKVFSASELEVKSRLKKALIIPKINGQFKVQKSTYGRLLELENGTFKQIILTGENKQDYSVLFNPESNQIMESFLDDKIGNFASVFYLQAGRRGSFIKPRGNFYVGDRY